MQFNYNHLRYFQAVAREGHLGRAAQKLNLTQSALSVQVRSLEERLGHKLFERAGRRLHLTEAGRIALDHAEIIFATGEDLVSTLRESGRDRAILRVGAQATLSRNFQLSFLQPLLGRQDVEIVLRSGSPADLLRGLSAHLLDVVLTNQPPVADGERSLLTHKIAEQPVSLVGSRDLVGEGGSLSDLLSRLPLVLPIVGSALRDDLDALFHRLGISPNVAAEVEDMAMMRLLVRESVGLACLPPIVIRDELAQGLLTEAAVLPSLYERFYAITLERRFKNPLLSSLIVVQFGE
jgi:LysR family transcriptional activator of nhaA